MQKLPMGLCQQDFEWIVQNKCVLEKLCDFEVPDDLFKLLLSHIVEQTPRYKILKQISVQFDLERDFAEQIYLTAERLICAHRDYSKMIKLGISQYIIRSTGVACDKCAKVNRLVFNVRDAKIGTNYPPLCSCKTSCCWALSYQEGITKGGIIASNGKHGPIEMLEDRRSEDQKEYAIAFRLYKKGQFKEAAEHGYHAFKMCPQDNYCAGLAEMCLKANRMEDAIEVLEFALSCDIKDQCQRMHLENQLADYHKKLLRGYIFRPRK